MALYKCRLDWIGFSRLSIPFIDCFDRVDIAGPLPFSLWYASHSHLICVWYAYDCLLLMIAQIVSVNLCFVWSEHFTKRVCLSSYNYRTLLVTKYHCYKCTPFHFHNIGLIIYNNNYKSTRTKHLSIHPNTYYLLLSMFRHTVLTNGCGLDS